MSRSRRNLSNLLNINIFSLLPVLRPKSILLLLYHSKSHSIYLNLSVVSVAFSTFPIVPSFIHAKADSLRVSLLLASRVKGQDSSQVLPCVLRTGQNNLDDLLLCDSRMFY